MIDVVCEQCGLGVAVRDEHAGKRFRCRGCRASVLVPETLALLAIVTNEPGLPDTESAAWAMVWGACRDSGRALRKLAVAAVSLGVLVLFAGWYFAPSQQSFRDSMAAEKARADIHYDRGSFRLAQAEYAVVLATFSRIENPDVDDRAMARQARARTDALEKVLSEMDANAIARANR